MSYTRKECGFCKSSQLFAFLDLGITPLTDAFIPAEKLAKSKETEIFVPLSVLSCKECGLAQLSQIVPTNVLYNDSYLYDSAVTKTGSAHWKELAETVWGRFGFKNNALVIDIGSNSGVLLENFKNLGAKELGVDPAKVPTSLALKKGINTIVEPLSPQLAKDIQNKYGKAKVICATNVFAHIDNVFDLFQSIDTLLDEKGVFVVEAPHFLELIKKLEYDTVYHEHIYYLAAKPMDSFVKGRGFSIFDIERQSIHGGSLRYYICRSGDYQVNPIVDKLIAEETAAGLYQESELLNFAALVSDNRDSLRELLISLKQQGKKIAAVGASAKGSTLTNYCQLGTDLLDFISEKSNLKIGTYSPGMHIPVVPDSKLLKEHPDYCLLLAWNFADEIINNLSEYREKGGKFIIPIPKPHVI